jgi:hypothetical protein
MSASEFPVVADALPAYRWALHSWAANYVPDGATVVKVEVKYDDGYDPTYTDGPASLDVEISYLQGGALQSYTPPDIEYVCTSLGGLLTELFRIDGATHV